MGLVVWIVAAALAGQSLGEIAEREKKRRARNAEAGMEAISYAGTGGDIAVDTPNEAGSEADARNSSETLETSDETGQSPLEAERARGEALEPRMEAIGRSADRVDRLYQRYMDRCYNRYAVGETPPGIGVPVGPSNPVHVNAGRDWFVVLEAPSGSSATVARVGARNIVLVQTVECQELWRDVVDAAEGVRQSMRELLADARREGILPGVIRELRRKYLLEWSGWER